MPIEAEVIYKNHEQIVEDLMTALRNRIPAIHLGEDGVARILIEVFAGEVEGIYLANQILRDNLFIQTANFVELERFGEMFGHSLKTGTLAIGTLLFGGAGGTLIPAETMIASNPGIGDPFYYVTTVDGTIPNPGIPAAPTVADNGVGVLGAGTYEYVVTFVTADGETAIGIVSAPLVLAASRQVNVTSIPVGGPGTTGRKIYRQKNGGGYKFVGTINDNVGTTLADNVDDASLGGAPLEISTAERVSIAGEAEEIGEGYNAIIGAITELVEVPGGVTSVRNSTEFSGGSNEQDMEDYRSDLLTHVRLPMSGSPTDLEMWAKGVEGVEEATAFVNDNLGVATNGHVTVRISGPSGSIPSAETIDLVQDELELRDIANITIHVATFTAVPTNVTVTITVETGFTLADVTTTIQDAILDYINSRPVGGTVHVAGIYDAVYGLSGVATLVVSTPATDQTTTATQKRTPGTITVN